MAAEVLSAEEREGLTIWGNTMSAQFREGGQLALHILEHTPRDVDDVALIAPEDVAKLHELINEAKHREEGE